MTVEISLSVKRRQCPVWQCQDPCGSVPATRFACGDAPRRYGDVIDDFPVWPPVFTLVGSLVACSLQAT